MGKPYSSDLRQRFVAALDEGMSASAADRRMRVAPVDSGPLGGDGAACGSGRRAADGWGPALGRV